MFKSDDISVNMHPLYISIILLLPGFSSTQNTPYPYNYTDVILLDCGSTADQTYPYDGRDWKSDVGSNFTSNTNSSFSSAPSSQHSSVSQVPYFSTARIILSDFTYSFPVSPGPKFLRLYFYPETYSSYDRSSSFFSVRANGFTLLSNFSAFFFVSAITPLAYHFSKEFVLPSVPHNHLNLTFTPAPDSYAFINAIEVMSLPADLYYDVTGERPYTYVNGGASTSDFYLSNDTSFETAYRLNVGGSGLSPPKDTGMFRTWRQDFDFVSKPNSGVTAPPPPDFSVRYTNKDTPRYTAPDAVYRTSRIMGGDDPLKTNLRYNLTWRFNVDSGFNYLVRLHFCETQPEITGEGQRKFVIFLNNQTAEPALDVTEISGGHGIAAHRDYVVSIFAGNREQELWLALHPFVDDINHPKVYDVILNGVEIFKLSKYDRSLAGLNPDPPPVTDTPNSNSPDINSNPNGLPIIAGAVSGVVGLVVLCFLIYWRRGRGKYSGFKDGTAWWGPFSTSGTKSTKSRGLSLPSDLCHHFSLAEIKSATNDFDQVFIIGVGGFGNVYKGFIDGGAKPVAIKRLNPGSRQGAHEFLTEIEMLSRLRHLHLVSLIGYCEDDNEMILVYDYMSRGTLRDHLYDTGNQNPPLPWNRRLEICAGAARGLQYLHTGAKHAVIHRDVKTTNILLDEKWVAKVSDFGLSRIGPTSVSKAHVTTVVKGSFGYLDPEYYKRQHLTEKSDVYSFGVVLCEVICGRPPVNRAAEKKQVSLAEWARESYRRGTFNEMVDKNLKGEIAEESLKKYSELAMSCLSDNGMERPSMSDVVWGLDFVLQLQRTAEERISLGRDPDEIKGQDEEATLLEIFSVSTESTETTTVSNNSCG